MKIRNITSLECDNFMGYSGIQHRFCENTIFLLVVVVVDTEKLKSRTAEKLKSRILDLHI